MRLTQKNEIFEYVLPCQNIVGDNQATEISLGETEYTCKKYVVGEAINKLGELEDVLESWHIENLEELKTRLHDCQVYHLKNNSNETLIHNLKNELAELKQTQKQLAIEEQDQDKILFAVEQLEKVKGLIANHTQELWTCENDDIDVVLYEEIDNQIKELKGKVETKLTHQHEAKGE